MRAVIGRIHTAAMVSSARRARRGECRVVVVVAVVGTRQTDRRGGQAHTAGSPMTAASS